MKKLGLIINPIAGMGGSVGLKGTDHVVEEAIRRGAQPRAGERVKAALTKLIEIRDQITVYKMCIRDRDYTPHHRYLPAAAVLPAPPALPLSPV